jgi:hypothetical protein
MMQNAQTTASVRRWSWAIVLVVSAAFPLLYPGHTPFINDEAALIWLAVDYNEKGELAPAGIYGSRGRRYGPVAVWFYQASIAITRDPVAVMSIHIAVMSVGLVASLAWLRRTLKLWRWGLVAAAMSPYVWYYHRHLWDNSLNIPLGALCLAAYASFLARPRGWMLGITLYLSGVMLLVHLMAAPLVGAIAAHLLIARWRDAVRYWFVPPLAGCAILLTGIPYWPHALEFNPKFFLESTGINGWWFALLGPRVLSGAWIEYLFAGGWQKAAGVPWYPVFTTLRWISLIAFPLTWLGLLIGALAIARRRINQLPLSQQLAQVCVVTVLGQILLNGFTHTFGHPHYYTGTFAAFAVAMWIGLDRIARWNWGRAVGWAQIVAVCGLSAMLLTRIEKTGGTRDLRFGATLANQAQVAGDYGRYARGSPIDSRVLTLPESLRTIEKLQPPRRSGSEPSRSLILRYKSSDPSDGRIELVESD